MLDSGSSIKSKFRSPSDTFISSGASILILSNEIVPAATYSSFSIGASILSKLIVPSGILLYFTSSCSSSTSSAKLMFPEVTSFISVCGVDVSVTFF